MAQNGEKERKKVEAGGKGRQKTWRNRAIGEGPGCHWNTTAVLMVKGQAEA